MALGDYIPMASDNITVPGNPTKISGGIQLNRNPLKAMEYWTNRPKYEIPPRPVDDEGVPQEFCSGGHYRPRRAFDRDASRKSGVATYCKQCRHEKYLRQSAEAAERASKPLHRYREKKHLRGNLSQGA